MKPLRLGVRADFPAESQEEQPPSSSRQPGSVDLDEARTKVTEQEKTKQDKHDVIEQLSVVPAVTPGVETLVEPIPEGARSNREILLQDQAIRLPLSRLLMIYFGIGLALVLSFMDQTSVSTAAPVIGTDIGGSDR